MIAANLQLLGIEMMAATSLQEFKAKYGIIVAAFAHIFDWKGKVSTYYEITQEQAKTRMPPFKVSE